MLHGILDEDPGNLEALRQLALLRRLQENWPDAKRLCEEILRRDPADASMRKNLAFVFLRLGERAKAGALYEEMTRLDPEDADALALWGGFLTEEGRAPEAIAALELATKLAPEDAALVASLGLARETAGDSTGALAAYDRALAIDAGASSAVVPKAILLRRLGRPDAAVSTLRAGLEQRPQDADMLNNLAWTLADAEIDAAEAFELARRAAALVPDDPAILDTLGWAAVRAGRPADAIAPLQRALASTGDPTVRAHLGIALAATGKASEGRAEVQRAAREDPSVLEIPEARALR
jgi:Tfp pilus assembly protein PilF